MVTKNISWLSVSLNVYTIWYVCRSVAGKYDIYVYRHLGWHFVIVFSVVNSGLVVDMGEGQAGASLRNRR